MSPRLLIFALILLLCQADLQAQKRKKNVRDTAAPQNYIDVQTEDLDTISILKEVQPVTFKRIGETEFYFNGEELNDIRRLQKKGRSTELRRKLERYVENFTTNNFSINVDLLWALAQIYEAEGRADDAKWMYQVIIKNTNEDVYYIQQHYDNLVQLEQPLYVPIDFYYELVEFRAKIDTLRPPKGVFINMGRNVNSLYEDYGPTLSFGNDIILFGTKRDRRNINGQEYINEEIYAARRIDSFKWEKAEPLIGVNSPYNEGAPCITRNGKRVYFARCNSPEVIGECDIFQADLLEDGTWGNVQNLGPKVNSELWDSHPTLSHSGDTMYFASDRIGGLGSNDIWYTTKGPNGKWTKARNMGPVINTKGNEVSPFMHPVHDVLYFSSTGQLLNFSNYMQPRGEDRDLYQEVNTFDIYKSYNVDGSWMEPKNIGPLINSLGDEFFFTIDSASEFLYYAKNSEFDLQNIDLYSFPLPMEAQPLATTKFTGTLVDSITGEAFDGMISVIDVENGIEVAPKFLRDDGSFEFELIDNQKYLFVIQGEDFFRIEQMLDLAGDTDINLEVPSIDFVKLQFESIEFASNSYEILPAMEDDLTKIRDYVLDNPWMSVIVSGHTDSRGDASKNLQLSQKRAEAIRNYLLLGTGILPDRIKAVGYGSTRPLVMPEKTDEDRRTNRRVEFEIYRNDYFDKRDKVKNRFKGMDKFRED